LGVSEGLSASILLAQSSAGRREGEFKEGGRMRWGLVLILLVLLGGCESQQPATRTGAALDRAGTETGQALNRAGAATGGALQRAGTATGQAVDRAGNWVGQKLQ
jgi:hypothetical protein